MAEINESDDMPSSISFEEIEAALKEPPPMEPLDKISLGDDIGSAADLMAERERLKEALRISEEARKTAALTARVDALSTPQSAPAPAEPKELSLEELQILYDENPLKAIAVMNDQATARVERNVNARLGTLTNGTVAAAEASARQKFSEEFEVLGAEIASARSKIPDQSVLASSDNWEELIAYVRGKHSEKFFSHKMSKMTATPEQVRAQQQAVSGFSPAPTTRSTGGRGGVKPLDEIEREIARTLGVSDADYRKYQ